LPHAGYNFSGQVAAYGYKAIARDNFETVILIGDSHCERFDGISFWEKGKWQTPLGEVETDEQLAKIILEKSERFFVRDSAHLFEHSLEVQLPFLQMVLKNFKILPIVFGSENKDWKQLAKAILEVKKEKKILIVASSDLSHYPAYSEAKEVDRETIEAILACQPEIFAQKIKELEERSIANAQTFACGQDSIKTILEIAKKMGAKAELLTYANSGDSPFGDKFQVVGYCAISFYQPL